MDFTFIRGLGNESTAIFESDNYYNEYRWEKLRGLDEVHPLVVLKQIGDAIAAFTLILLPFSFAWARFILTGGL